MFCHALNPRLTCCDCTRSHWSVNIYNLIGVVSSVAFAVLLTVAIKRRIDMLPYAIASGTVMVVSFPAAYLINKYYTLKTLDDVSQSIGATAGELDNVAAAFDQEGDELRATINTMHQRFAEKAAEVERLTVELEGVEERLRQTEDDLTATFQQSRTDMQQVIDLLDDDDDLAVEIGKLGTITRGVDQLRALASVVKLAMQKAQELLELAEASKQIDETWDENLHNLDGSTARAQKAAELMRQVQAKMQELLKQAKYMKVGRLLEREQPVKFKELVAQEVTDGGAS